MKATILGVALAAITLTVAQGASAQQACVKAEDLSDTITYAMPAVYVARQADLKNPQICGTEMASAGTAE